MPDTSSPIVYYSEILPRTYASTLANAPADVLNQPELTVTMTLTGENGGTFGLRAHGTALEFVPGGIPGSDLVMELTVDDWRSGIESGDTDALLDYVLRRKIAVVKSLRGTVNLELTDSAGGLYRATSVFGGQAEPEVTMFMTTDDYAAMLRGDLNGQMAFMMGKLKFEGSLPLLLQVGNLAG